jgi:hypothetical protein
MPSEKLLNVTTDKEYNKVSMVSYAQRNSYHFPKFDLYGWNLFYAPGRDSGWLEGMSMWLVKQCVARYKKLEKQNVKLLYFALTVGSLWHQIWFGEIELTKNSKPISSFLWVIMPQVVGDILRKYQHYICWKRTQSLVPLVFGILQTLH